MVREWYIKPKSINDQQLYRSCSAAISSSNGKKTPSSVSRGIKLRKKSKKKLKNKTKKNNAKKIKPRKIIIINKVNSIMITCLMQIIKLFLVRLASEIPNIHPILFDNVF